MDLKIIFKIKYAEDAGKRNNLQDLEEFSEE